MDGVNLLKPVCSLYKFSRSEVIRSCAGGFLHAAGPSCFITWAWNNMQYWWWCALFVLRASIILVTCGVWSKAIGQQGDNLLSSIFAQDTLIAIDCCDVGFASLSVASRPSPYVGLSRQHCLQQGAGASAPQSSVLAIDESLRGRPAWIGSRQCWQCVSWLTGVI